jgi:hypothetical protein
MQPRPSGLCRRKSTCHVMSRLKCLYASSSKYQITIPKSINCRRHHSARQSSQGTSCTTREQIFLIRQPETGHRSDRVIPQITRQAKQGPTRMLAWEGANSQKLRARFPWLRGLGSSQA